MHQATEALSRGESRRRNILKSIRTRLGYDYKSAEEAQVDLKDRWFCAVEELKVAKQESVRVTERRKGAKLALRPKKSDSVPVQEIREYWESIIGKEKPLVMSCELEAWAAEMNCGERSTVTLDENEWHEIFRKVKPWKATGPDGIHAYWWKTVPVLRSKTEWFFNKCLEDPRTHIQPWMC